MFFFFYFHIFIYFFFFHFCFRILYDHRQYVKQNGERHFTSASLCARMKYLRESPFFSYELFANAYT